uniref:Transmembrane protein n=1 Tax=Anopheles maculatus TaxID=74869 RepID=A0A182SXS4_9DIPT
MHPPNGQPRTLHRSLRTGEKPKQEIRNHGTARPHTCTQSRSRSNRAFRHFVAHQASFLPSRSAPGALLAGFSPASLLIFAFALFIAQCAPASRKRDEHPRTLPQQSLPKKNAQKENIFYRENRGAVKRRLPFTPSPDFTSAPSSTCPSDMRGLYAYARVPP